MIIRQAFRKGLRRGRPEYPSNGRMPSPYMIRLEGETTTRRLYEDWSQLEKNGSDEPEDWSPVPYVVIIKGEIITLTTEQRAQVIELAEEAR